MSLPTGSSSAQQQRYGTGNQWSVVREGSLQTATPGYLNIKRKGPRRGIRGRGALGGRGIKGIGINWGHIGGKGKGALEEAGIGEKDIGGEGGKVQGGGGLNFHTPTFNHFGR